MAVVDRSGILHRMARGRRRRLFAPSLVLLALIGTWTGHTLEYARVAGRAGLREEVFGSVHLYMFPAGALLVGLAALGGVGWWRTWQALGRRLDAARDALGATLRGRRAAAPPAATPPSVAASWGALTLVLVCLQLVLYLGQENLETHLAGAPVPGLRVFLVVHAAAPLVHLAVAGLLAALMVRAGALLRRRAERITGVVRLLRILLAALAAPVPPPKRVVEWRPSPLDRLGGHLWRRPPPISLLAR
jgi:hypothetical protein